MKAGVMTVVAVTLSLAAVGCSTGGGQGSAGDCNNQVRADGIIYTSVGIIDREATRFSTADLADCDDAGADAHGSVFPEHPQRVDTWEIPGYSTDEVLAIRLDQESLDVLVSEAIPAEERERILDDLAGEP